MVRTKSVDSKNSTKTAIIRNVVKVGKVNQQTTSTIFKKVLRQKFEKSNAADIKENLANMMKLNLFKQPLLKNVISDKYQNSNSSLSRFYHLFGDIEVKNRKETFDLPNNDFTDGPKTDRFQKKPRKITFDGDNNINNINKKSFFSNTRGQLIIDDNETVKHSKNNSILLKNKRMMLSKSTVTMLTRQPQF